MVELRSTGGGPQSEEKRDQRRTGGPVKVQDLKRTYRGPVNL
ncbi:hypothetical protein [Sulfuracidifex metallicus]|nr:hypothetical protein [Sulfuracidifex metallicus]